MKLLVYSKITPRTRYIFSTFLADRLRCEVILTDDKTKINDDLPVINYSDESISGSHAVKPTGLLFGSTIKDVNPEHSEKDEIHYLFGEDIFSGMFYLLTRYEEFTSGERDEHYRFAAKSSIAYKCGFLQIPVVDIWIEKLKKDLTNKYHALEFKKDTFRMIPSFDLDNAYAYRGKGFFRNLGGLFRDMFSGRFDLIKERLSVVIGSGRDPYDTYDYITSAIPDTDHVLWFIPVGIRTQYDKNLPPSSTTYKRLISKLADHGEIGIHPSYGSNFQPELLPKEIKHLGRMAGKDITISRQHYLKLELPETYRQLSTNGLKHDHSMGYADHPGFRAGTSKPFGYYDLKHEEELEMTIHPFAYMDGTFHDYQKISPEKAKEAVRELYHQVKNVNGDFIFIWHNDSVRDNGSWKGWRELFEYTLNLNNGD